MKKIAILTTIFVFGLTSCVFAKPIIISTDPFDGELGVSTETLISAQFSEQIDHTTLNFQLTQSVKVKAIDGGIAHSLALKDDGKVIAWGLNRSGQTNAPIGLNNVVAIAGGGYHSMALKDNGSVVAWGNNYYGQTNVPAGLNDVVAIAAGSAHSMALKDDGSVVAWGYNHYRQSNVPVRLSNVVAIAAGSGHSMTLKDDGTVFAWGDNYNGQIDIPAGLSNVVAISAGYRHSMALKDDGTVVAWGHNYYGQSSVPAGLNAVVAIVAGIGHSMALKEDGSVVAWGKNSFGQSNVPVELSNVEAIAAGDVHSLALKNDGTVVVWGWNYYGITIVPETAYKSEVSTETIYEKVNLIANLKPFSALELAETYTASIIAQNLSGEPMDGPHKWTFTTQTILNVPPVADAGVSQSVTQGNIATLDGSNSYDADADYLYYNWQLISQPELSLATINDSLSPVTSFIPDVPGEYQIMLIVNDGKVDSEPAYVSTLATSYQNATLQSLQMASEVISQLDELAFSNKNMQKTFGNKNNAAIKMIEMEDFNATWKKLEFDLLNKTDGCINEGIPDNNDWLEYCEDQIVVAESYIQTINSIAGTVNWTTVLEDYVCTPTPATEVKMIFKDNMTVPTIGDVQCVEHPDNPVASLTVYSASVNRPSLILDGKLIFGDLGAVMLSPTSQ